MDLQILQKPFGILGDFMEAMPYGSGHINDTYAAVYNQSGRTVRYLHQRINNKVFTNIPCLMENIRRVTRHTRGRLEQEGVRDRSRRGLTLLPAEQGLPYYIDPEGSYWRTYLFIEGARTYDRAETPRQAREAARAFGEFQARLSDLPGDRLYETIPDFHDTRARLGALKEAIDADPLNRASHVRREIDWFLSRENLVDVISGALRAGEIPERITHNDTKLNNVMLDDETMEGVCVIDLDTVMPGSVVFDFGDMVRSATNTGREDEEDVSKVGMDMEMFAAIVEGYLSPAASFLTDREMDMLAFSGQLITMEIGMRFLTDYLGGDEYFKIHRENHNLARCRVHMTLVESIEKQRTAMERLIKERTKCEC